MKRIGLILLACFFVVVGCSDDDAGSNGDNGDAGQSTEDTGVEHDIGDTSRDTGDAARDTGDADTGDTDTGDAGEVDASQDNDVTEDTGPSNGGEVDQKTVDTAGEFVRAFVDADGRAFRYHCECWWEESGYDDEQECLDGTDYVVPDDVIEDAAQCFEGAVADYGEPAPESGEATLECLIDAANDYEQCEDDLRDEYDDFCKESAAQSLEECDDAWYDAVSDSCEPFDDDGEVWLDDVFDAGGDEECFASIPHLL